MVWGWTPVGGVFLSFLFFGRFVFGLFSFYFALFLCFFKRYFHILTDLNYAGRLIASSLSAFISKIINPRVGYRHPLISFSVYTYNSLLFCRLEPVLKMSAKVSDGTVHFPRG